MDLPLKGIRILDLTRLLPGPYCTLLLGDLGAEVIKVESPHEGDHMRWIEPKVNGMGVYFLTLNRNKKSITLNLKSPTGVNIFKTLSKTADVVFESFRPGVLDRLGVGYEALKEVNPGIVFCSLSGFGQGGPYKLKPGHDLNYISIGGLQGLNGNREGLLVPPAVQIADLGCGAMTCAVSILGALLGRERTGEGAYLDVPMLDGIVSWMSQAIAWYYAEGNSPEPGRQTFSGGFPSYHIYKTKDGKYVSLGCVEEKFWVNFCEAVGRSDLSEFHLPQGQKQEEVFKEVEEIFLTKTRDEWVQFLDGVETCFAPVNDISETISDPQVRHREIVTEIDYGEGKMVQVAFPARFSGRKLGMRSPPPKFGEHTEAILKELGYASEEIRELREEKVI